MDDRLLRERYERICCSLIEPNGGPCIPRFDEVYCGSVCGNGSSRYNSPLCSSQIAFALATSDHSAVDSLISHPPAKPSEFDPTPLRESQVLSSEKILDLGCGPCPTFARVARILGADVYTADRISSTEFCEAPGYQGDLSLEEYNHIQVNFRNSNCIETIAHFSGGDFDLSTEAHLSSGGFLEGERIGLGVLKPGGIHFCAGGGFGQWSYKE